MTEVKNKPTKVADKNSAGKKMGEIIKRYRECIQLNQKELLAMVNEYLTDIGEKDKLISQSSFAKIEDGRTITDYNVSRFLYDRILRTDMEEKTQIFNLLDMIIEYTDFSPKDIVELFYINNKKELIDFLKNHARDKDPITTRCLDFIDNELNSYSFWVHFDAAVNQRKGIKANSTGTLLVYLVYVYIIHKYCQSYDKAKYNKLDEIIRKEVSLKTLRNDNALKKLITKLLERVEKEKKNKETEEIWKALENLGIIYQEDSDKNVKAKYISNLLSILKLYLFIYIELNYLVEIFIILDNDRNSRIAKEIHDSTKMKSEDIKFNASDPLCFISSIFIFCQYLPRKEYLLDRIYELSSQSDSVNGLVNITGFKEKAEKINNDPNINSVEKILQLKSIMNILESVQDSNKLSEIIYSESKRLRDYGL